MKQDFWLDRWQQGHIGFHQPEGHPLLHKYWPQLELSPTSRVLVPLCGKSRDMIWLADQGHFVTGIELSEIAAQEFFAESGLSYKRKQNGAYDCFIGSRIEIRIGDLFDLPTADLARFDAFYDRAALIALPEDMRSAYVGHVIAGLGRGTTGLLITLGYDQTEMNGPPFSVDDAAVGELYGHYAHVDLLAEQRNPPGTEHLRHNRGLSTVQEGVYRIVRT